MSPVLETSLALDLLPHNRALKHASRDPSSAHSVISALLLCPPFFPFSSFSAKSLFPGLRKKHKVYFEQSARSCEESGSECAIEQDVTTELVTWETTETQSQSKVSVNGWASDLCGSCAGCTPGIRRWWRQRSQSSPATRAR